MTLPDVEQGQRYKTNWGLLDMIAAMKWSQTYGPLFGVNIHEASMTAYSSGAEAIWRLITIPVVWPWIQRVNIMGMSKMNLLSEFSRYFFDNFEKNSRFLLVAKRLI